MYLYYSRKDSVLLTIQLWSTFASTPLIFLILLVTSAVFQSYVPSYFPHKLLLPCTYPMLSTLHFPNTCQNQAHLQTGLGEGAERGSPHH